MATDVDANAGGGVANDGDDDVVAGGGGDGNTFNTELSKVSKVYVCLPHNS